MASGIISQKLRASSYMSKLSTVRLFNTISGIGSIVFLFTITLVGCESIVIIVLLCCSMLAVGAYCGGSLVNHLDLGSNFAGTTSGISTTMSSIAAILTPVIAGELTNDNKTLSQWHTVFYIAIGVTFIGYLVFMIFGSVEEQPWNKPLKKKSKPRGP
ncbi:putative transporter slc-17.2 [Blattella germanica]|nr:putative transporter slc-17.2 [Blattella germanica]